MAALCVAALIGFAANSLLCRAALGGGSIDAASFTAIRLASGAAILAVLARRSRAPRRRFLWREVNTPSRSPSHGLPSAHGESARSAGGWGSAIALFGYAAAFSFAYLRLTTATGALILFAAVQITMITRGVVSGERPGAAEWLGMAISIGGLVVLTLPGLAAPDPLGAALMAVGGLSWGVYSLRGRGAADPLAVTADNFARTLPFAALLLVSSLVISPGHASTSGAVLAASSGAIASGIGYSLWYAVLPQLPATRAAIVQLAVPVLAAAGGSLVLGEALTLRFVGVASAIIAGVALAVLSRRRGRARANAMPDR